MKRAAAMPPAPAPKRVSSPRALALTEREAALFETLLSVVRDGELGVTLRVAGGWVRDKVLAGAGAAQDEEVDVDIALDSMLGREFAECVNTWLKKNGMAPGNVGVISKNPDQSKHLETATMRVMGVSLDLVNLRTETYSHDSRIPDVQIGTPYEDAMRRDLTINALFYNVNEEKIEDFTGHGFDDIRAKVVRTPLPPLTTLLDDPLRALRAIRFASRLNFAFDTQLFDACRNPEVHAALGAKVSRERVSTEIDRIMASARPIHALGLLVELGLFPIVFRVREDTEYTGPARPPPDLPYAALGCLINLDALWHYATKCASAVTAMQRCTRSPSKTRIACYAAVLAPLAPVSCMSGVANKRKRPHPLVQHILRSELRMSSRDVADVVAILDASLTLKGLVHRGSEGVDRLTAGRALRSAGPCWRIALQIALITEISPACAAETYAKGLNKVPEEITRETMVLIATYGAFLERVEAMCLGDVWDAKPSIDGRELFKLLPRMPRGPAIGKIMGEQVDWLIENPTKTREDVQQWLLVKYKEYTAAGS